MNVCPVLVGRESELAALEEALQQRGVIWITGEAGIGKSRLIREFAAGLPAGENTVLWGRPEVLSDPGPFSLLQDFLDEASTHPDLRIEAEEIARLLDMTGEPQPRQVAARVRGLLGAIRHPVAVFEDLHEADEMSLAVIGHLARVASDDQIMLVGTFRPESSVALDRLLSAVERDRLAETLRLEPLSESQLSDVLKAMWERAPSAQEVQAVARLADGIPYFVEELASSGGDEIPDSIARGVRTRMSSLDEEAQRVVQVASLVVGAIDPALVASVAGVSEALLPEFLIAAVRAGLLVDHEGRLVFRHSLIREGVARTVLSVQRQNWHLDLAARIAAKVSDDSAVQAANLARHFSEGGDRESAAHWAIAAGRRALEGASLEEARRQFESALRNAQQQQNRLRAREGISEIRSRIDPTDPAEWESLAVEYEGADDIAAAVRCLSRRAEVERWRINPQGAEAFMLRAAGLPGLNENPEIRAQVAVNLGLSVAEQSTEAPRSSALLTQALELAKEAGRSDLVADALQGLGDVSLSLGRIDEALGFGQEACRLAIHRGDPGLVWRAYTKHAQILFYAGRTAESLGAIDTAEEWARSQIGGGTALSAERMRARIFMETGQPEGASTAAARLMASVHSVEIGSLARMYGIRENDGEEAARDFLDAWWDVLGGSSHRMGCLERPEEVLDEHPISFCACLAEMLLAKADTSDELSWWADVLRAFADYYAGTSPTTRLDLLGAAARASIRLGSLDLMRMVIDEMGEPLRAAGYPFFLATHSLLAAHILAEEAAPDEASQAFWDVAERFRILGNGVDSARCLRLSLQYGEGKRLDDQDSIREILDLATTTGAQIEAAKLEERLRRLGHRPRSGRPRGRPASPPGTLSAREEEVAVLVAAGATNAEIARRLVLSPRTVEDHISRAQRRLGVNGRAGLATWAAKKGLV